MKKEDFSARGGFASGEKNKTLGELQNTLKDKRSYFRNLRFRIAKGKVKNVKEMREVKKYIARLLTEINRLKKKE